MVEESEVVEAAKEGTDIKTPDDIPVHDLDLTATVGKVLFLSHSFRDDCRKF